MTSRILCRPTATARFRAACSTNYKTKDMTHVHDEPYMVSETRRRHHAASSDTGQGLIVVAMGASVPQWTMSNAHGAYCSMAKLAERTVQTVTQQRNKVARLPHCLQACSHAADDKCIMSQMFTCAPRRARRFRPCFPGISPRQAVQATTVDDHAENFGNTNVDYTMSRTLPTFSPSLLL